MNSIILTAVKSEILGIQKRSRNIQW